MKVPANAVVPTSDFYQHLPAVKNKDSVIDILCRQARGSAGRRLREVTGASILVAKTIGTASEQCFACGALEEDRHVARSLVDNFPHDLLVDNVMKFHRIPVKTLTTENPNESNSSKGATVSFRRIKRTQKTYHSGVTHYFEFFVLPLCIIDRDPIVKIGGCSKSSVYPSNYDSIGRLECYKEA